MGTLLGAGVLLLALGGPYHHSLMTCDYILIGGWLIVIILSILALKFATKGK